MPIPILFRHVASTLGIAAAIAITSTIHASPDETPDGFVSLFNGSDLTGWIIPEGDGDAWKVVDGVIDYRAQSKAPGSKDLWTENEFGDFILKIDWRIIEAPTIEQLPVILPDGTEKKDANGHTVTVERANADSGIFLRGIPKSQVNIWCWPVGSGEVYGYRTDPNMPADVRAAVTPKTAADNPVGEWNTFVITMQGEHLTVELNGQTVIDNARLPDVPAKGRFALQHHGGQNPDGSYLPASSLVQFRNIFIKQL